MPNSPVEFADDAASRRDAMSRWSCGARSVCLLLALSLLLGCAETNDWPKRYPVSGKVTVDGKPVVRAMVVFHPVSPRPDGKKIASSTFTNDDGTFQLTTYDAGDGAPPGEYKVTIVANFVVKNGEEVSTPDLLKGRYQNPNTTKLTATVREEENVLPTFDLKS